MIDDLKAYLNRASAASRFTADLGIDGGYLNFTNSGQRGGIKAFTLSLSSLLQILIDIRNNFEQFSGHATYVESEWRDLGGALYTDGPANALSTVQTKPLFATLSKFINWANGRSAPDDSEIVLTPSDIDRSIDKLKEIIEEFTPRGEAANTFLLSLPDVSKIVNAYNTGLAKASIYVAKGFPCENIAAIFSKNLLIFTGLSGAGKTQLAKALPKWITPKTTLQNPFSQGLEVEAARSVYTILDKDRLGLKIGQSGNDSHTFLPFDLIEKWAGVIEENGFDKSTPSQTIQEKVIEGGIEYSGTLNSFHSPLKALAFHLIENKACKVAAVHCEIIAVGADWTSNENLLGYPDALKEKSYRKPDNGALDLILRAKDDPENPYFLILDEMNLSHVERYFADFLSAMESGEAISLHDDTGTDWNGVPAKLKIPKNLFVIGTVNVDETTYMFSPKVLDRANVIEFRVSDDEMKSFLENPVKPDLESIAGQGAQYAKAFVTAATQKDVPLDAALREQVSAVLMEFFPQLKEAGAEFGYRTAHEICRFVYFHKELSGEGWEFNSAMDAAIMQKLLPKLHGSKKKLGPILEKLNGLCGERFPASSEKICRMQKRLAEHGFTSFAEA